MASPCSVVRGIDPTWGSTSTGKVLRRNNELRFAIRRPEKLTLKPGTGTPRTASPGRGGFRELGRTEIRERGTRTLVPDPTTCQIHTGDSGPARELLRQLFSQAPAHAAIRDANGR